jgi:hypothetical protein
MNSNGAFVGFVVDSIRQLAPGGAMAFRVTLGAPTLVEASDTSAQVQVDGVPANVYRNVWLAGSTHTIAVDSAQLTSSGTARYVFASWSDGGARSHTVNGSLTGATFTAHVSVQYLALYAVLGVGTVAASRAIDPVNGTFLAAGDTVTLTATASAGQSFLGWSGDTTAGNATLKLRMGHPFSVTANFAAPGDVVQELLSGAPTLMPAALEVVDRLGNNNGRFDLGDLVAWLDRNPGLAASPAVLKLMRSLHK